MKTQKTYIFIQGRIQVASGSIATPKTCESNFVHLDIVLFGKQLSRYKAILPSIVLSQQCCEVGYV